MKLPHRPFHAFCGAWFLPRYLGWSMFAYAWCWQVLLEGHIAVKTGCPAKTDTLLARQHVRNDAEAALGSWQHMTKQLTPTPKPTLNQEASSISWYCQQSGKDSLSKTPLFCSDYSSVGRRANLLLASITAITVGILL